MRRIKIKYKPYKLGNTVQPLPMVRVILANRDKVFPTPALVDSGSTSTFIPLNIARSLMIKLDEQSGDISGVSGHFSTHVARIDRISVVEGGDELAKFMNQSVRVPANENGIPFVILGRDSIFRRFDITFQERLQQIQLDGP